MTSRSRGSGPNRSGSGGSDTPSSTEPTQLDPGDAELRALLVELRAGRRQEVVGKQAGLTQSKVSRAERGTTPFTEAEAEQYAVALGADPAVKARIVELSAAAHDLTVVGRGDLLRDATKIQRRTELLEGWVRVVRSWQPVLVPGTLQTPEYTAAVVDDDGGVDEEWLAVRAARRARLQQPQPHWHQLVSEAALRWVLGGREVMAGQLEHLAAVSEQSNVRLGVLPLDTPLPLAAPAAFHLYGSRAVAVAVYNRTSFLTDERDLADYRAQFDRLAGLAIYDDEARRMLRRLARKYRKASAT